MIVTVPPTEIFPAVSILPLTEAAPLITTLPPKLPVLATVIELTEISPPTEAVIPVRLDPSP